MTHFIGTKYEATKGLPATAIAKLIRADLKAAGIAARVRTGKSTWTSTISVALLDAPATGIYRPEYFLGEPGWMTEEAAALVDRATAIANAYNRDRSDSSSDYFDVRFYENVDFASSLSEVDRPAAMARAEEIRAERRAPRASSQEQFLAWAVA